MMQAGLRAEPAARAAERLARVPPRAAGPLFRAPAAFACARIVVPSRNARPSSTPRASASRRCHTPSLGQRMNSCAAIHQGPRSAGIARHAAPFRCRQTIASRVRRSCLGGTLARGRHASTNGSKAAHSASASTVTITLSHRRRGGNGRGSRGFRR
jgi:hypothetical protein